MSRLQDWVKIFPDPAIASGAQREEEMGNFVQPAIPTESSLFCNGSAHIVSSQKAI
jgi:hypothetical protein